MLCVVCCVLVCGAQNLICFLHTNMTTSIRCGGGNRCGGNCRNILCICVKKTYMYMYFPNQLGTVIQTAFLDYIEIFLVYVYSIV